MANFQDHWYQKTIADTFAALHSSEQGLSTDEAVRRGQAYRPNKLPEVRPHSTFRIFFEQFQSPLIYLLVIASGVVFWLGETSNGFVILAVLVFNAIIGTIQEGRSQNALLALKRFVESQAIIVRDGKEFIVRDTEVVVGDVILLQEGEKIPADARVIDAHNLKTEEAEVTGESTPSHKTADAFLGKELAVSDQRNMVFKGTRVVAGNGKAVVTEVGEDTVVGHIASEILDIDTDVPLKVSVRKLSQLIIVMVLSLSVVLFLFGVMTGKSIEDMFVTVVSLAVAIIPEGLPVVLTLVLATGVWRMSKQNAMVKKLPAVQALGQVDVIAVDKTGTLTKNEMTIQKVYVDGKMFEIGGVGYDETGSVRLDGRLVAPTNHHDLLFMGRQAAFCSNARILFSPSTNEWRVVGDPTEAAMLVLARKLGFQKDVLEEEAPLVAEIPFDYHLKYHATTHRFDGQAALTVVGAPEEILHLSKTVWQHDGVVAAPLTSEMSHELHDLFISLSQEGLRVVAVAGLPDVPGPFGVDTVKDLMFIGFLAMKDAPRLEVPSAIRRARNAGICVVMITGDHKATGEAVAREVGIYVDGDEVVTGEEMDRWSDEMLAKKLPNISVFARVTPDHKLRIVNAYRKNRQTIAMTGDGVNDAPSLSAANLGVAMGRIGTEVAKEAADIVLLDDNFESIIAAIEEGRSVYKTIKKVILYCFATSIGEAITITLALFFGLPLPILPAQIIWLNFVTDGFLDTAIAMEPKEKGLLREHFERPTRYLIDRAMFGRMLAMAFAMTIGTLYVFWVYLSATGLIKALTVSLTTLAVFQWLNAWNCRSEDRSIFQMNPFSNKYLVGATIIIVSLHLFALYNPVLQKILHTSAMTRADWVFVFAVASSIVVVDEVRKFLVRREKRLSVPVSVVV